ncbi:hypothetical protein GCM10010329_61450 [Streptomyces spiroverticillatus]|uniref:Uncharacterized protein n=1 Tax=Streptomyces finlayi TaxID=67296 RepID=A0A919CF77_9ACTN|nr:hypothetical protein [Streptomyces finlayi]GHA29987.1 hypothetical protein GCM10010329_61450 [Streptomyces spiroverticillatus]GHD15163.1 hypothetical protein GCM10010334_75000 [Streptomyces finlayi]
MKKRLIVTAMSLAGVMAVAAPAHATTAGVSGSVKSTTTYYTTARTITTGGTNVYLRLNARNVDMKVWWYKCSDKSVRGSAVIFWAADTGRKTLGTNFTKGASICLAAAADIGQGSATWSGTLTWNVTS